MADEKTAVTAEDVRGMDRAELEAYVAANAPEHDRLMEEAEAIMVQARPLNENLFVARNRLAEMGVFKG
ncbi:hypothetical protein SEA_APIARY_13 [Rhodococcus phage Apiary]|nr:hypothetical protein SEA_BRAXOADDIE_13 [Rhodococcus phage Braxoaddie]WNM64936.1 hypothetical protein SEA_MASELOP_13 [Rhodococcus phage Maselop]WNM67397.1 hypothetical protein SEA_POLYYUKI_13 [Rhodococcus phage Polyyuki]WNM69821.1 hypothetical protein SEA_APIARY_13 [Rhodococcus phage Apiary]